MSKQNAIPVQAAFVVDYSLEYIDGGPFIPLEVHVYRTLADCVLAAAECPTDSATDSPSFAASVAGWTADNLYGAARDVMNVRSSWGWCAVMEEGAHFVHIYCDPDADPETALHGLTRTIAHEFDHIVMLGGRAAQGVRRCEDEVHANHVGALGAEACIVAHAVIAGVHKYIRNQYFPGTRCSRGKRF